MKKVALTNQFKRDAKKHFLHLASAEWADVLYHLTHDQTLPVKYRDHALEGNLKDLRDCHIQPDLILLYRKTDKQIEFVRLGSHSELGI